MKSLYNRYIPQSDGSFQKNRMADSRPPQPPRHTAPPPAPPPPKMPCPDTIPHSCKNTSASGFLKQLLPKDFDTGDLLVIILLLLMAGDCEDEKTTVLLTLILYFFM